MTFFIIFVFYFLTQLSSTCQSLLPVCLALLQDNLCWILSGVPLLSQCPESLFCHVSKFTSAVWVFPVALPKPVSGTALTGVDKAALLIC